MRINEQNKSMDIEPREINFVMEALLTQYLFNTKNQMPEVITFPMYKSAKTRYGEVPIQFVLDTSEIAQNIINDGSNVPEVTPAQEAALDEKDDEIKRLKDEVKRLTEGGPEAPLGDTTEETPVPAPETSKAKAAFAKPDRLPKQPPGGAIAPGSELSDMQPRDSKDLTRTKRDLVDEPDTGDEKEFDKTVSRDEQGRPVVEE